MAPLRKTASRRTLLAAFCAVPMLSASYAAASSLQDALREAPIDEPIMVETLLGPEVETVCVLQPYQNQLTTRDDVAERLNAQLRAEVLTADEGHFIFAIVRNHALELNRIKRSTQLDIFSARPLSTGNALPDQFVQAECSSGHAAAIVKVMYRERAYIMFGAMHR